MSSLRSFRFNSTLVQLKVFISILPEVLLVSFNSTLVQLKGTYNKGQKEIAQSFNSTLVQLKVVIFAKPR